MKRVFAAGAFLALLGAGCSGSKIVPVSGVVKLDGAPYRNAVVSFQPLGDRDNPNPGRGSAGVTDENGHFTLVYDGQKSGALIGRHRVRIFTKFGTMPSPEVLGPGENSAPVDPKSMVDPIPAEWNEQSQNEFEVQRGGTSSANFDITTKRAPGK